VKLDLILIEMFQKKNRVLIATILTLTLGIPISAISMGVKASTWSPLVSGVELTISGIGKAEWTSSVAHSDDWSILLEAPGQATWNSTLGQGEDVNEGRIVIRLAPGTTLGDIESLSWWVNTTTGYPPHADLLLDLDGDGVFDGGKKDMVTGETLSGDDDILVAEFAYQPYTGPGYEYVNQPGSPYGHYDPALQGSHYNPSYDVWVQTFQNETSETGTLELYNETVCWLYRGLPGPFNGSYFGKLEDFKEESVQIIGGTEFAPVNSSVAVLEIHIEADNWLGAAKAYVDDIAINGEPVLGELMAPVVEIISPEHKTYASGDVPVEIEALDIFGVDTIWYNVKKDGSWIFGENQTYTVIHSLSSKSVGDYRLYAWANNTLGLVGKASVQFHVRTTSLTVEICPKTLNLKSNGKWVTVYITFPEDISADDVDVESLELEVDGKSISALWARAGEGVLMVKFSRGALKEIVDGPGEVEIQVSGDLEGGGSFEGFDTIRVINPGKKGPGPHGNQNGWKHQEQNHKGTFNGKNPEKGNQEKSNKGGNNK
jgi:hypothetical protein